MLVHIAWCFVALVAAFLAWHAGVASGERTSEGEVDTLMAERDRLRVLAADVQEAENAAGRWRRRYMTSLKREEALRVMVDRLLPVRVPDPDEEIPDPPSIGAADSLAAEEQRIAALMSRTPVAVVGDADVPPPPRLMDGDDAEDD